MVKENLEKRGFPVCELVKEQFFVKFDIDSSFLNEFFLLIIHVAAESSKDLKYFDSIIDAQPFLRKIIISASPDDTQLKGYVKRGVAEVVGKNKPEHLWQKIDQLFPSFSYHRHEASRVDDYSKRVEEIERIRNQWERLEEGARNILREEVKGYIHWREAGAFVFVIGLIVAIINWAVHLGNSTIEITPQYIVLPFSATLVSLLLVFGGIFVFAHWQFSKAIKRRLHKSIKDDLSQEWLSNKAKQS